jgi:hypothetical protein
MLVRLASKGVEAGLQDNYAYGYAGTVTVAARSIALTGVSAAGAVGAIIYAKEAALTGVQAQGAVGNENAGPVTVALSGVNASGDVATLGVNHENALIVGNGWGTGAWGEYAWGEGPVDTLLIGGQVGNVSAGHAHDITGVEAKGYVGTFGVIHTNGLLGVLARGYVGNVSDYFWTTIDDNQIPDWHNIDDSEVADSGAN